MHLYDNQRIRGIKSSHEPISDILRLDCDKHFIIACHILLSHENGVVSVVVSVVPKATTSVRISGSYDQLITYDG